MDPDPTAVLPYRRARFTTQLPTACLYTSKHFWLTRQEEMTWRVGLTKFGSRMLGEMVDYGFDTVPGTPVVPGQVIGWIEGFKALSELGCVVSGEFLGPNAALDQHITLVNQDPYDAGWLYAVRGEPGPDCLDVRGYARLLDETIDGFLKQG